MHKMHNLFFFRNSDYVDSDDKDPPIEHRDYDGGPPQDQDPLEDSSMRALEVRGSGPGPVRMLQQNDKSWFLRI